MLQSAHCSTQYSTVTAPNHFSGPGKAIGLLCVCLCVWTITSELNDIWPRYLARWFILTLSRSSLKGQGHRSKFTVTGGHVAKACEWQLSSWAYGCVNMILTKLVLDCACSRCYRLYDHERTTTVRHINLSVILTIVLLSYTVYCKSAI